jgi:predicted enzyme related to lactoylglutathione lyase
MSTCQGEVVLVRIAALEPARAARFYALLFGWRCGERTAAGIPFWTPGGLRGVFRAGEPSTAGPELYVQVTDLASALTRGAALGGSPLVRAGPGLAGGRAAVLLDPEGNRVGLWEAGVAEGDGDPLFLDEDQALMMQTFGGGSPSRRR